MAKVHPEKHKLPTGEELMTAPMFDPRMSSQDRTVAVIIKDVQHKLTEIAESEEWQTKKAFYIIGSFICCMIGTLMILIGLRVSVLFAGNPLNIALAVFGGLFYVPFLYALYLLYLPSKEEKERREMIEKKAQERSRIGYLEEMEENARKKGRIDKRVRVIAIIRGSVSRKRQELPLNVTTIGEVFQEVHVQTGLPLDQMVVKYNDVDYVNPDLGLAKDLKMSKNDNIFIYNKGKFMTNLKKVVDKKYVPKSELPPVVESPKKAPMPGPTLLETMGLGGLSFHSFSQALPIELPSIPTSDLSNFRPKLAWDGSSVV